MEFEVHLPTLLLISAALNVLIGALLWWIYNLRARQDCFRLWAFACGAFAIGSLLAGARAVFDLPFVTVFLAHGLLGLSPLLLLNGLQGFSRLPARHNRRFRRTFQIGFGVYLLLLLGAFQNDPNVSRAITAFFSALIFSVAIYRLSAIAVRIRMPVHVLQVLFTIHGVLMMVQALVITANAVTPGIGQIELILRLILINHILLATCTAMTLPLMAFSVSENRLRALAERDALTGLYNRRSLFREGIRAFNKASAEGSGLAVLMLDLDHFKRINDQWGHAAGDEALRLVSRTLEAELRKDDVIGRVGGEEFAVVLPLSADEDLAGITDRLLNSIAQRDIEVQGNPIKLSASIGGIELNDRHTAFADMMLDADAALYFAKNNGRNRAEFAGASAAPAPG